MKEGEQVGSYYLRMHNFLRSRAQITRQDGSSVYQIKPAFSLLGRTLAVQDEDNHTLAWIRQIVSLITPKFRVEIAGQTPFVIQRRFSLSTEYTVKGRPWIIKVDSSALEIHVIHADGSSVLNIYMVDAATSRQYRITAATDADALTGICIVAALVASRQALRRS